MSNQNWNQTIMAMQGPGPTLAAAAAASMLATGGQGKFIFPANLLKVNDVIKISAKGVISCAVTTPGTARFDIRFGAIVVYDTGALNLNVVSKSLVPWSLDIDLNLRAAGAGSQAQFWGQGVFSSEAVIASPLPAAGGNGILNVPVATLALGSGFDSTVSNAIDAFFTQTVATGSLICQQFRLVYET